jgi:hypothetical protein
MPVFGDKGSFGLSLSLDSDYSDEWLFGKFCYWISGMQVGDYDLGASLRDVMFDIGEMCKHSGKRDATGSLKIDQASDLFDILNAALYLGGDPVLDALATKESWARHDLNIHLDVMGTWKVFALGGSSLDMVVFGNDSMVPAFQGLLEIPKGTVDSVLIEAYGYLDEAYKKVQA